MPGDKRERLIYLLRHGKIAIEQNERRYIGQIDIPLSDEGVCQAYRLQEKLAGKDIAAVFCSDLTRSVHTARIIAAKLELQVQSRRELREISMGEWEGKSFREIAQAYPEEYARRGNNIINYRIPGAESFAECKSRILAAFTDIVKATAGNLLIVGHAGTNRLLLCHILGMPLENLFRISQDYGCVNILAGNSGQYRVKLLNGLS
ncbi:alpha-ribazole phosphatase [Sporomusa sphaeroides]|uniref:Alpha-ribazole phosphatase n=2 Tax=Sporomusa TaxID=2375 RepID=A0ABM9W605_9FIRM|nr:alpha-ribazole phosphatase [Sporomusa sphaeroides]OLS57715.1 putative phosphoserine phosphatase 2 [Sporomusa sphaeroides DSM 2875]CVK20588.1 Putative phosphoserine phosphatase 2 [Sporomusa sphaeroides DSM 2875]SCM80917.1 Fructose-2,6-bisphosphatase [uncultured Sporomusa sp.]